MISISASLDWFSPDPISDLEAEIVSDGAPCQIQRYSTGFIDGITGMCGTELVHRIQFSRPHAQILRFQIVDFDGYHAQIGYYPSWSGCHSKNRILSYKQSSQTPPKTPTTQRNASHKTVRIPTPGVETEKKLAFRILMTS
jgi:hypothetical protein